jgi:hypothetical protein
MTFGSVFGRTFSPTFQPKSQAAAVAGGWWLSGGIAAANCIAAYQPKGAADIAAAKVNLNDPGTNNAITTGAVGWDSTNGLKIEASNRYITVGSFNSFTSNNFAAIIRFSNYYVATNWGLMGCSNPLWGVINGMSLFYGGNSGNPNITSGVLCMNGVRMYQNGFATGNDDGRPWTSSGDKPFRIGYIDGRVWGIVNVQAFALYRTVLTPTQNELLATAMAAL